MNEPVIIDPELQSLIPPLTQDEFKQLEDNCKRDGILDSLKVWHGILIDGHNRYRIAEEWDLNYATEEMDFPDKEAVVRWIIMNQFGRRNLSLYDRSILALKLKPVIAGKAKERMASAPQKKAEREKELQRIWDEHDFDTARALVDAKKRQFAKEDGNERRRAEKCIYYARFDNDKFKIGSSSNPSERVKQLSVSCPGIELVEIIHYGEGAEKHENSLKKKFAQYRIGNECYQCSEQVFTEMVSFTKKEASRKNNTDYELAKIADVSHDTIHKVEVIETKGSEPLKEQVRTGQKTINQAWLEIKDKDRKRNGVTARASLERAEQRHEEFQNSTTVSIKDAKQEKEDLARIANDRIGKIKNALNGILFIGATMHGGDIDLSVIHKSGANTDSLKNDIKTTIAILSRILKEIER